MVLPCRGESATATRAELPGSLRLFGYKDGISHPAIEGSGIPGSNPQEKPLKPGEYAFEHQLDGIYYDFGIREAK